MIPLLALLLLATPAAAEGLYNCKCVCEMATTTSSTLETTSTSTSSSSTSSSSTSSTSSTIAAGPCGAPIILPPDGGIVHGTTTGSSQLAGSCNISNNSPEVVYSWTPARSGQATIETCSTTETTFDTVVYLRDVCGGPDLVCNDDTNQCGTTTDVSNPHRGSRLTPSVIAGHRYFLIVDGYNGKMGDYRLSVKAP